jgi:hypothetical protein
LGDHRVISQTHQLARSLHCTQTTGRGAFVGFGVALPLSNVGVERANPSDSAHLRLAVP